MVERRGSGTVSQVNRRTLLEWARRGQIKGYRLSGAQRVTWRFLAADLDESLGLSYSLMSVIRRFCSKKGN